MGLRLAGVEKTYPGGYVAVAGIDLDVAEGEMLVLLGPSGCGKSTLLRMIAGIEIPTAGRILIDGNDVSDKPPQQRDVAMVFQNYALYPHMTVRENLAFGLRMRGVAAPVIAARVAEVAASLGLEPLLARRPSQLSGGQRQRVALGRAIARQPRVFLLDEPLSNLDVQLRVTTRMELARLHRGLSVPMVYVTHDQEEAMTLGDRIAVMQAGKLLQVGAPLQIYERPRTQFVGGFVGSPRMNFLPGQLAAPAGGRVRLEAMGVGFDLPLGDGATLPRDVVTGVRPEDLEIVPLAAADWQVRADVVEPLGRETLVHAIAGADTELRVLAPAATAITPGMALGLRARRERLHLFDATTLERLVAFDHDTKASGA
jgi:ABC-type sugar transport system ATPase subunit